MFTPERQPLTFQVDLTDLRDFVAIVMFIGTLAIFAALGSGA